MHIYARQGDLVITKVDESGEYKSETNPVLAGKNSSPHTVRGRVGVRRSGNQIDLLVKKPTELVHSSRHRPVTLEPGAYTVTRLRERGDQSDRAVED